MKRPALGVFLILWASYAFFWQARDWNTASRLMLTYSLVDRGTVRIDGLEQQTGDRAAFGGHSYSDKLPGYSFLAAIPYAVFRRLVGFPTHPLNVPGVAHWTADYAVTLFTSGLATASCGALLVVLAGHLGCGPRRAALVGLAYGLATPAYAYATLAHGHQTSAACLLGAFALLWRASASPSAGKSEGPAIRKATADDFGDRRVVEPAERRRDFFLAGLLAAFASTVELQVGPVSGLLGIYALALVLTRAIRPAALLAFALGALIPTLFLLAYNTLAFGSPLRMGYFYHATQQFADVHSASNPLGLRRPDWSRLDDLTILPARGIVWYAPVLLLAPPGWIALVLRRQVAVAVVSALTVASVVLVNLSYPEWSGGWSTGPRLLVPMLPFAMLPVAGLLAAGGRFATALASALAVAGAAVILLFQGVGARVPNPVEGAPPGYVDPLRTPLASSVLPLWRGEPPPPWTFGQRFARNLVLLAAPAEIAALPASWQWVQFAPLVLAQGAAIAVLFRRLRPPRPPTSKPAPVADPPPARPAPA